MYFIFIITVFRVNYSLGISMHVYEYVGMCKFGNVTQRLPESCRRLRWRVLPIGTRFGIRHCCGYYI